MPRASLADNHERATSLLVPERDKLSRGRVLVVDDDESMRCSLVDDLASERFEVSAAVSVDEAVGKLRASSYDAVVSDLRMPHRSGLDLVRFLGDHRPVTPIVVVTAFGTVDSAVEAIRQGAYDFLAKPFDSDVLALTLDRAVRHARLSAEVEHLKAAAPASVPGVLGESQAMRAVLELVARVADLDVSVLLTGETGSGKEVIARALHRLGQKRSGPFVAVNTTAMPETLLESQLFGHEKGAFTDAQRAHKGLFVEASGGTLFLDEIGHMPMALQPKLLRALQERCVRPLGAERDVPFDARLVSATNVDLEVAVEEQRFREDLYYRINVVHIRVPPLRERGGDVLLLAQHFLTTFQQRMGKDVVEIHPAAAEKLLAYPWPGNVRELSNCIERAVALCRGHALVADDLPERVRNFTATKLVIGGDGGEQLLPLDEVERRYVLQVFEATGKSRTRTAEVLRVDRKTLYRKLKLWGVGD